jgi:hypothetical protein
MIHTQPGFRPRASADANEALQKVGRSRRRCSTSPEDHDSLSLTMTAAEVPLPGDRDGAAAAAGGCRRLRAGGGPGSQ